MLFAARAPALPHLRLAERCPHTCGHDPNAFFGPPGLALPIFAVRFPVSLLFWTYTFIKHSGAGLFYAHPTPALHDKMHKHLK